MKTLTLALTLAALSFAGGFYLEKGHPSASKDPRAQGALATVRVHGCHQPEQAKFSAVAVNEKNETRPVELVPLATPGQYAVKEPPFRAGQWTIIVTAEYQAAVRTVRIPIPART
jgi:hypothetical protein